ncbi:MAG: hypothetical protein M1830_007685 [Pleopsidium flavum]|nr:MAG: hypothetical protein M1830_007685 [Pleopsidium flavum]
MISAEELNQKRSNQPDASITSMTSEKRTLPQQALENGTPSNAHAVEQKPALISPGPPPDGGLAAWLQVACSWLIFFNVLGILNTYGQFQTIYETDILINQSSSNISWIGSVQFLLCYLTTIFTGPIWDSGHLRFLLIVGTVISVFGMMMLSLCHTYWQFFLAQAIVVGVGFGFVFMPASAIVPQWFSTKNSFAVGVATTGSSIGAVIYPVLLNQLKPQIGFAWTVRVMGFIIFGTMLPALALMRLRNPPPATKRALIDLKHLKDIPYLLSCLGFFIGFLGLYVFYYYIQLYAVDVAGTGSGLAFYLLSILNAASFFGRLIPNYAAGNVGPMNTQVFFGAISGILSFCLLAIKNTPGVIAFSALYGFVSGPFVSLPIPVIASVSPDKSMLGTRLGMSFAFIGFGVLIGEPVAGAILGSSQNWVGVIIWCGVMLLASSCVISAARIAKTGLVLKARS